MKLPDVNVWLAASWSRHSLHNSAKEWVDAEQGDLAFCRVSQMAFLRLLTNREKVRAICCGPTITWPLSPRRPTRNSLRSTGLSSDGTGPFE